MKSFVTCMVGLIMGTISVSEVFVSAQSKPDANSSPQSNFTTDYPKDETGVLIENSSWTEMPQVFPSKTHAKRGIAASLTYGAVPALVVAQYDGLHAQVELTPGRPILCICHMPPLPGAPTLVRLHP